MSRMQFWKDSADLSTNSAISSNLAGTIEAGELLWSPYRRRTYLTGRKCIAETADAPLGTESENLVRNRETVLSDDTPEDAPKEQSSTERMDSPPPQNDATKLNISRGSPNASPTNTDRPSHSDTNLPSRPLPTAQQREPFPLLGGSGMSWLTPRPRTSSATESIPPTRQSPKASKPSVRSDRALSDVSKPRDGSISQGKSPSSPTSPALESLGSSSSLAAQYEESSPTARPILPHQPEIPNTTPRKESLHSEHSSSHEQSPATQRTADWLSSGHSNTFPYLGFSHWHTSSVVSLPSALTSSTSLSNPSPPQPPPPPKIHYPAGQNPVELETTLASCLNLPIVVDDPLDTHKIPVDYVYHSPHILTRSDGNSFPTQSNYPPAQRNTTLSPATNVSNTETPAQAERRRQRARRDLI